jgi:hypothetical protein
MLLEGSRALGLPLTQAQADTLSWLAGELGRWSVRINLTAILDPIEMADKHILDSLTVLRALEAGTTTLLDAPYLRPGGTLVVMTGSQAEPTALEGWGPPRVDQLRLPLTGDGRTLLSYRKASGVAAG